MKITENNIADHFIYFLIHFLVWLIFNALKIGFSIWLLFFKLERVRSSNLRVFVWCFEIRIGSRGKKVPRSKNLLEIDATNSTWIRSLKINTKKPTKNKPLSLNGSQSKFFIKSSNLWLIGILNEWKICDMANKNTI